jgi:hypothetical protein
MKRRLLIALATLALLGGSLAVVPRLLWGDHADYSQVVSIERGPSYQAPSLLERAWHLPVAALYRGGLDFQHNGSFCGPTSVVNVVRSLGQPAEQATILDGTALRTVFGLLLGGATLDELAGVAGQKTGRRVTVLRDLDLAAFRAEVARANDPTLRYIANFSRGPLFGRGGGHHSPIAGYLAEQDLVFVLDVNEKYRPWLVPTERLWAAVNTVDPVSHRKRGLLRLEQP